MLKSLSQSFRAITTPQQTTTVAKQVTDQKSVIDPCLVSTAKKNAMARTLGFPSPTLSLSSLAEASTANSITPADNTSPLTDPVCEPGTHVLIWHPSGLGSSSFGHVSTVINDTSYSFQGSGMRIEPADQYLSDNQFRSADDLSLNLSPDAQADLENGIKNFGGSYNFLTNNCTDPVETGLEKQGYDLGINVSPSSLGNAIQEVPGLVKNVTEIPEQTPSTNQSPEQVMSMPQPPAENSCSKPEVSNALQYTPTETIGVIQDPALSTSLPQLVSDTTGEINESSNASQYTPSSLECAPTDNVCDSDNTSSFTPDTNMTDFSPSSDDICE